MRSLYGLFLWCISLSIHAQILFNEVIEATFVPVSYSHSAWADYDLDGDYDVALMGQTQVGARIASIYRNNGDSTFTDMLAGLPGLSFGALAWNDFDRDGDPDLALCGKDAAGVSHSYIHTNTGGVFSNSGISLTGLANGSITWHDYNCDGKSDLLITGQDDSGTAKTILYRQSSTTSFQLESNFSLTGMRSSFASWADLNNDGRKDLIVQGEDPLNNKRCMFYKSLASGTLVQQTVTGISGLTDGQIAVADIDFNGKLDFAISGIDQGGVYRLEVYRNLGSFLFSKITTLTGVGSSTVAFADADNDGDPDLLYSGQANAGYETGLYVNNNLTFTKQSGFTGTYAGNIRPADFDSDHDLDFLLCGAGSGSNHTQISRNLNSTANSLPEAPTNLSEVVSKDSVVLSWSATTDANGGTLNYNIFIGLTKTSQEIMASNSTLVSGFHRVLCEGNAGTGTSVTIRNLEQGKYYWSVQALDNSLEGSPFAVVDSFVVCKPFSLGNDTTLCYGDNINLHTGVSGDEVNWYSVASPIISMNSLSISHPITVNDTIWAQRYNAINGCLTYDTITVQVNVLPTINAGADSSICLNSSIALGGSPTAGTSVFTNTYRWYPAYGLNDSTVANPTAQPLLDTLYNVIVKSGACEADTAEVRITIDPLPEVNASADTIIGYGESVALSASGAMSYSWSPSLSLNGPLTASPLAKPNETTLYIVTGTDFTGCTDTADVKVSVENRFFIPDLFSPDGDGNNDVFLVYGVGIQELELRIYNQSGLEVYSSNDVKELTETGWDGKQNGKALYGQALLWTLKGEFADGTEVSYKGKKTGTLILKR